jgi:hypothetical protein
MIIVTMDAIYILIAVMKTVGMLSIAVPAVQTYVIPKNQNICELSYALAANWFYVGAWGT